MNADMEKSVPTVNIDTIPTNKYTLEDAIKLTGNGKFHVLIVIFSGMALMAATGETISVSTVLPYAKCDLQMTTKEQGLLSTISYLGIVISSHTWGFLADTWGRRKVIRLSTGSGFVFAAISAFISNVQILIALRFLVGVFVAGVQAAAFSYVSEFHTKEKAPRAASFTAFFIPCSMIFLSALGFFLIPVDFDFYIFQMKMSAWRLVVFICSLINLVNFIAFTYLPESPQFLLARNKEEETLLVLGKMYAINSGASKKSYPVKELEIGSVGKKVANTKGFVNMLKYVWNQTRPIFVPPQLDSTVKLCYIVFVLFATGQGALAWFPEFLVQLQSQIGSGKSLCEIVSNERKVVDPSDSCDVDNKNNLSYVIMAAFGAFCCVCSALMSFYVKKIGPRILIPTWLIVASLCCLAIAFLVDFYLIAIAFIPFLSCSITGSTVIAISVTLYPTNVRAMATCFIFMFGRFGSLVGGNLVGLLLENSCDLIFYIFTALVASCILVFLLMKKGRETNTETLEDKSKAEENCQDNVP